MPADPNLPMCSGTLQNHGPELRSGDTKCCSTSAASRHWSLSGEPIYVSVVKRPSRRAMVWRRKVKFKAKFESDPAY